MSGVVVITEQDLLAGLAEIQPLIDERDAVRSWAWVWKNDFTYSLAFAHGYALTIRGGTASVFREGREKNTYDRHVASFKRLGDGCDFPEWRRLAELWCEGAARAHARRRITRRIDKKTGRTP